MTMVFNKKKPRPRATPPIVSVEPGTGAVTHQLRAGSVTRDLLSR